MQHTDPPNPERPRCFPAVLPDDGATLAVMSEHTEEGFLSEATRQWIQSEAERHHGGNFGAAAAAILEAVHAAELAPNDPWAGVRSRVQHRVGQADA